MCEIVICAVDQFHPDPITRAGWFERGCVVRSFEDGHVHDTIVLTSPTFRILIFPGIPASFGRQFEGREIGNEPASNPYLLARLFRLDLDHADWLTETRAYFADESRAVASHTMDMANFPFSHLFRVRVRRPSLAPIAHTPRTIIG